jgi:MFS family permease
MYHRGIIRSLAHLKVNVVIKILILSDFAIWSAANLIAPIFAIFVVDKIPGGSIEVVGIATMIFLVVKSIFEVPIGIWIDKSKSEKDDLYTAFLGTLVSAAVYFLYPQVDSVVQLYLLQALLGVATAAAYPGWFSIFTRHIDKSKEAFEWSLYDVLLGLGMAATAALGAFMVDAYGFDVIFYIIGTATVIGALLLVVIKNKVHK